MALLSRVKTRRIKMDPVITRPGPQIRTSRPLHITTIIIFIIIISGFLGLESLDRIHQSICRRAVFLANTGLCPTGEGTEWNLFYHLGGNGPWIRKTDGMYYYDCPLPKTCHIDQVHMLSRHAERYPTRNAGSRHLDILARLDNSNVQLTGPLAFVNSWKYFTDPENPAFENLTWEGPYAGTRQASNAGRSIRQRYNHLVSNTRPTKFWTCSAPRDVETAEYFGDGFFGSGWRLDGTAVLEIVPETEERGASTLTPGDTCHAYIEDRDGHDKGYDRLAKWQEHFAGAIAHRLADYASGVPLSPLDVYGMMEMCGFEILAEGSSPWCDVFTKQEWLEFEYGRDILHYYRAGPGNKYAATMGWLWLNATKNLLMEPSANDVYFSFVHDGDIVPVLATLGIFSEIPDLTELPSDRMVPERRWKTSDVVPMGGRLIFERITCDSSEQGTAGQSAVRLFVNDALIDLTRSSPAATAFKNLEGAISVEGFQRFVDDRGTEVGDFREICRLPKSAPASIDFLHQ